MLAEQFDVFLLDLDGVVYVGARSLPHTREALQRLRTMGKTIRFLTNDPVPARAEIVERLRALSIEVELKEVVTSGWATAQYLWQHGVQSAYVLGSTGLASEIGQLGIRVLEQGTPEAVVVGCDQRVTYRHLQQAMTYILQGAHQVGITGILVARQPVRFPAARDFRALDATIVDLRGLFEPDVVVRQRTGWAKPDEGLHRLACQARAWLDPTRTMLD